MGERTKAREKCGGNKRLVSIEFILYMLLFTVSKFPLARKTHSRKSSHLIPLWYSRSLLNNNNVRMKYAKCAHQTIICTAISRHNIGFLSPSPKCESLMKTDAVVLCWAQFHWLPYNTCSFFLPYSLTKLRRFFPDAVVVIAVVGGGWVLPFVFLFIVVIVCNIKYIHHIYTFSPADVRFTRLPRYLFYVCAIFPRFQLRSIAHCQWWGCLNENTKISICISANLVWWCAFSVFRSTFSRSLSFSAALCIFTNFWFALAPLHLWSGFSPVNMRIG